MTKKEIYRLKAILEELKYIKQADTDKTATQDRFDKAHEEGIGICEKSLYK